jgi:NAD-dependent dihydropyrimidine dehydrogenase PreA subunit
MKRKIIQIDERKCNGCGLCVPNCPEGALQIIDGKARLVGEILCDGLGACLGHCPEGAITIEERNAETYDETKVMANVVQGGPAVIAAHLRHLRDHRQTAELKAALDYLKEHRIPFTEEAVHPGHAGGCPGSMARDLRAQPAPAAAPGRTDERPSALQQWPVQLQLLNPSAPYFRDAELVVAADCVPFAYASFHERFLRGKILIILCPKLDRVGDQYLEKLTEIFTQNPIRSVSVIHMEVPCCFGAVTLVREALKRSGRAIPFADITVTIAGEVR